jgi:hypothetical protein
MAWPNWYPHPKYTNAWAYCPGGSDSPIVGWFSNSEDFDPPVVAHKGEVEKTFHSPRTAREWIEQTNSETTP